MATVYKITTIFTRIKYIGEIIIKVQEFNTTTSSATITKELTHTYYHDIYLQPHHYTNNQYLHQHKCSFPENSTQTSWKTPSLAAKRHHLTIVIKKQKQTEKKSRTTGRRDTKRPYKIRIFSFGNSIQISGNITM